MMALAALAAVAPGLRRPFGPARGDGVHWLGILFVALLFALLVALVVWIVLQLGERRRPSGTPAAPGRGDAALETLRIRYARGELDRDSYLRMTYDLGGPAAASHAASAPPAAPPAPGPQDPPASPPPGT